MWPARIFTDGHRRALHGGDAEDDDATGADETDPNGGSEAGGTVSATFPTDAGRRRQGDALPSDDQLGARPRLRRSGCAGLPAHPLHATRAAAWTGSAQIDRRRHLAMARRTSAGGDRRALLVAARAARAATVSNTARAPTSIRRRARRAVLEHGLVQTVTDTTPGDRHAVPVRARPARRAAQPTQADGAQCGDGAGGFAPVAAAHRGRRPADRSLRAGSAARHHVVSRGRAGVRDARRCQPQRGSAAARDDRPALHDQRRRRRAAAPARDRAGHGRVRGRDPERARFRPRSRPSTASSRSPENTMLTTDYVDATDSVRHQRGSGVRRPVRLRVRFGERSVDRRRGDHADRRRHRTRRPPCSATTARARSRRRSRPAARATDSGGTVYVFPPGGFRFPVVPSGNYRFEITPPPTHSAPSTVPPERARERAESGRRPVRRSSTGSFGRRLRR